MEKESNRPEIILAAGMPRSGSTWLYNAVRLLIASKTGSADFSAGWIEDFDAMLKAQRMLLKIHDFDESWSKQSSLILYSFRDVRDVLASMNRKFGVTPTFQRAKKFIENDVKWRSVSLYNLRYETMLGAPKSIIEDLSGVLAIACDSDAILSKLNSLDYNDSGPKNDRYHMTNLLHKNHITDGRPGSWKNSLDETVVKEIEQTFRGWFLENDYSLSIL
jgi:hypothetical protein